MSNIAIEFENISKQYALGTIGTGTLSRDLNRWWARIRGREDPYLRIGEVNDRSQKATGDFVWALRDIDFKVEQGEVLGIIGKNGAGKSTLLKILSRVTSPTTGCIRAKGRIASLLEVGTGFHPEMTGRENIYMNGSIMGMTKAEITRKLDEIVAFAGVEKYIDTPVKRYSSGMTVRLGFAIAAHLEPEILVVDEVLAVGDAEFQRKAIGKMQDVAKGEGRTVLFVSHNMDSMLNLCNRGVLLKDGYVEYGGSIQDTVTYYVKGFEKGRYYEKRNSAQPVYVSQISLRRSISPNEEMGIYRFDEPIVLQVCISRRPDFRIDEKCIVGIHLLTNNKMKICTVEHSISELNAGQILEFRVVFPSSLFAPGRYSFSVAVHTPNVQLYDVVDDVCDCVIWDTGTSYLKYNGVHNGFVVIDVNWNANLIRKL